MHGGDLVYPVAIDSDHVRRLRIRMHDNDPSDLRKDRDSISEGAVDLGSRWLLQCCCHVPSILPIANMHSIVLLTRYSPAISQLPGRTERVASDLPRLLREAWQDAPEGDVVVRIHLFGIRYAEELRNVNLVRLVESAGIPRPYATEIRKAPAMKRPRHCSRISTGRDPCATRPSQPATATIDA